MQRQKQLRRFFAALRMTCALGMVLCLSLAAGAGVVPQPSHGANNQPGYLGLVVRDVSEEQVSSLRLHDAHGAVVVQVDHDGPAGKMGLRLHDVVVQMNGIAIEGEEQIRRLLHEMGPGRSVTMVVAREGQAVTLTTVLADREQVDRQAWAEHLSGPQAPVTGLPTGEGAGDASAQAGPATNGGKYSRSFLGNLLMSPSYTGAVLEKMGPQLAGFFGVQGAGLLVRNIEPNSPAAMAGMRAGDVVVRANTHDVDSLSQWAKLIKEAKGRPVTVVVMRDKAEKTLTLMADGKRRSSVDGVQEHAEPGVLARLMKF